MSSKEGTIRLYVVDALRGLAIVSIMFLHNLMHFDLYYLPPNLPTWMIGLDAIIWDSLFFIFEGKSYSIFALLFGLTFFIQSDKQEKKGKDFRIIFAWRLILLFLFGIINSAFYQGDILMIYAVIGFFLIPVARLNNRIVLIIAFILALQPMELVNLIDAFQNSNLNISEPKSWVYFEKMNEYIKDDSILNTIKGNLTNGKMAVLLWSNENGRFLHILSLFMFGMFAGRKKLFVKSLQNNLFWKKTLILSTLVFIPLFILQNNVDNIISNESIRQSFFIIITSWANIAFTLVLISGFVLLFSVVTFNNVLSFFAPIGRMSLTNYILQSIIGSTIYYGFGFGLYKFTGATYSFLISLVLTVLMWYFSSWWLNRYKRGPLETIWHRMTWVFQKNREEKIIKVEMLIKKA